MHGASLQPMVSAGMEGKDSALFDASPSHAQHLARAMSSSGGAHPNEHDTSRERSNSQSERAMDIDNDQGLSIAITPPLSNPVRAPSAEEVGSRRGSNSSSRTRRSSEEAGHSDASSLSETAGTGPASSLVTQLKTSIRVKDAHIKALEDKLQERELEKNAMETEMVVLKEAINHCQTALTTQHRVTRLTQEECSATETSCHVMSKQCQDLMHTISSLKKENRSLKASSHGHSPSSGSHHHRHYHHRHHRHSHNR